MVFVEPAHFFCDEAKPVIVAELLCRHIAEIPAGEKEKKRKEIVNERMGLEKRKVYRQQGKPTEVNLPD